MAFWNKKKDDDLGLDMNAPKDDLGLPPLDNPPGSSSAGSGFRDPGLIDHPSPSPSSFGSPDAFSQQKESTPMQQSVPGTSPEDLKRDIELMIAKLDAIKAELDAVNQRIIKIERIADEEARAQQKKIW
jgi:hypothetical protein